MSLLQKAAEHQARAAEAPATEPLPQGEVFEDPNLPTVEEPEDQQEPEEDTEAQARELLEEQGIDVDAIQDEDFRKNIIRGMNKAQKRLADARGEYEPKLEALKKEHEELLAAVKDPKQAAAIARYHGEAQAPAVTEAPNPYGDISREGDSAWDPEALRQTQALAYEVLNTQAQPLVQALQAVHQEVQGLKAKVALAETKEAVGDVSDIDGVDLAAVQKFATEHQMSPEQAFYALHGKAIADAAAARASKATPRKRRSPHTTARQTSRPPAGTKNPGKPFEAALDEMMPQIMKARQTLM